MGAGSGARPPPQQGPASACPRPPHEPQQTTPPRGRWAPRSRRGLCGRRWAWRGAGSGGSSTSGRRSPAGDRGLRGGPGRAHHSCPHAWHPGSAPACPPHAPPSPSAAPSQTAGPRGSTGASGKQTCGPGRAANTSSGPGEKGRLRGPGPQLRPWGRVLAAGGVGGAQPWSPSEPPAHGHTRSHQSLLGPGLPASSFYRTLSSGRSGACTSCSRGSALWLPALCSLRVTEGASSAHFKCSLRPGRWLRG